MLNFGLLVIGFIIGFLFKDILKLIKDKFNQFSNHSKEEVSDELFLTYLKTFRSFNDSVLSDISKTKFLKSEESSIKQDNILYNVYDSYFVSENFIYLYRTVCSLMSKEELSIDNFRKGIFDLKEIKIDKEQLALMDIDETLKKLYFKDYSCFPPSFLEEYYFDEKIFVIPTLSLVEREKEEKKKEIILDIKETIQTFLEDVDDIEVDILTGELIENINIILSKLKNKELDEKNYDFFLTLLNNIKGSYTLLWDNVKNNRDIKESIEDIEFNLNILNDILKE